MKLDKKMREEIDKYFNALPEDYAEKWAEQIMKESKSDFDEVAAQSFIDSLMGKQTRVHISTKEMVRVYPVQDDDGDWYVIPYELRNSFFSCLEAISSAPEETDQWYEELSIFEHRFSQYQTGGDLNLINLYADI